MERKVPENTINRLSAYLRCLRQLEREGVSWVTSFEIADRIYLKPSQVRRDLSYFGQFGSIGRGYDVGKLAQALEGVLGLDRRWSVALVGAGNLGAALFTYPGFKEQGFEIVAIFDNDPSKIGAKWGKIEISEVGQMAEVVKERQIKIGVIAVPYSAAQKVADQLINSGIKAILNFAPYKLSVPEGVKVRNVDMATELESLSYFLSG